MTSVLDRDDAMLRVGDAHGKVILFGEHAVVYGVPAIAVGIERGARATASARESGQASMLRVREREAPGAESRAVTVSDKDDAPIARAFRDLLDVTREAGGCAGPVAVDVETDLPPGGGLGCSAALGVAVARALDPGAPAEVIAERANVWERVFHGNPSGVDAAVAALGGCILFTRGGPDARASIERVRVPAPFLLCVGNSGHSSSTRAMVEAVARLKERRPETTQKAFDAIHTLVKNARLAIEAADRVAVGQLLDLNQMLLSGLFVSTPELEQMCAAARSAGALGAKLTGAGGGGCVVALVDRPEVGARVLAAWKSDGFDGFLTRFGEVPASRAEAMLVGAP